MTPQSHFNMNILGIKFFYGGAGRGYRSRGRICLLLLALHGFPCTLIGERRKYSKEKVSKLLYVDSNLLVYPFVFRVLNIPFMYLTFQLRK